MKSVEAAEDMVEILQNKNAATRFQILVEIAAGGQGIQQKQIAARLGVTPQAVSEYVRRLTEDGMLISVNRSGHRISPSGVNWMLKVLRELQGYVTAVQQAVTGITVCAAIADADIKRGQRVGLLMRDGLLYATLSLNGNARGTANSNAKQGEDVGVADIEGLVDLDQGSVDVFQVPGIAKGGTAQADLSKLKAGIPPDRQVGAIGIEALAALRRIDHEPNYIYGVTEALIEAAQCGLSFVVVVTDDAILELLKRLEEEKISYRLVDVTHPSA